MSLLMFALFGLVIGAIAKFLMPGRDPGGFIVTALIGMAGSLLGAFLGRAFGLYSETQQTAGWLMSILGSIALLAVYRLATRQRVAV